ncbi:MAG: sigma-70 family RNA polymerase sigma factor [Acutalibacteraceae bacterium]|nr:sigma-70 family RNA polymerase sigma factor [Bacillota bacterium]
MNDEQKIIEQVYKAKINVEQADYLINDYLPFIRAETAKFLKRPPIEGHDDELSIAMIAFHEAIGGYTQTRGTFLKYAAMLIRSRLIDYHRREQRHRHVLSLDMPTGEDDAPLIHSLPDATDHIETVTQEATRAEIEELIRHLKEFGITLSDVADNCPKQQRTLSACRKAFYYAQSHGELLTELLKTKRLPLAALAAGSGVERKTLERHRTYMIALLLIGTNRYEIMRGHIKYVMKGEAVK